MHDMRMLIEGRLARALQRLRLAIHPARVPLEISSWTVPGEPVPVRDALRATYRPAEVGDLWGSPWATAWFHVTGTVPDDWAGRAVEAVLDLGFDRRMTGFQAEGLVYRPDGTPVKGLHPQSQWVPVGDAVHGGERVDVYVEAAANPMIFGAEGRNFTPTRLGDRHTAGSQPLYVLGGMDLAVLASEVWELMHDLEVLGQLAASLPDADARAWEIWAAIDASLDRLDFQRLNATVSASREALTETMSLPARASAHRVSAVGHAHIDSAWLWPIRETVRKVARTVANVLQLMDGDPDLVYAMSSAQQYVWLKESQPQLYRRVTERVREGRFTPVGSMWVEADTNLPGGEALARQFCYGKRFFLDEFGVDTPEVWLPDSFGYSAALPQLAALAGARWFLSQKLSWNQTNGFPHHTFWWEGIDGTRLFTHFPPVDTYNSTLSATELAHAASNFAEKGNASMSLVPFGHGDGGGGPTREMLARAARLRDLDGSPQVRIESPSTFFERAVTEYPNAPVWLGELYLEFHRGTYTSQAAIKRGNRRSEHLLREAELWCATATVRAGVPYPYEALERIWRVVLLQQFHDILPGSSIQWVVREAVENYAAISAELEALVAQAQRTLAGTGTVAVTFNAAPHRRSGIPAAGADIASAPSRAAEVSRTAAGEWSVNNGTLRVTVDGRGLLTSVRDLAAEREVLAPGTVGNLLQLHPDTPNVFDAWDLDSFYSHESTDLVDADSITPVPSGVEVRRTFGRSSITQTLTMPSWEARLDIACDIDWQEDECVLKAGFVVDVAAERFASEVQFGHVYRPTHRNTTWDAAKFEVCAHRWVQVEEAGYGVAVVNDSTYGHDVQRCPRVGGGAATRIRLSLLRSPRSPDPDADRGRHQLRYALLPSARITDAVRHGYSFNLEERVAVGSGSPVAALAEVDEELAVVESVKLADDRSGDVVIRLYEAGGGRRTAAVRLGFPTARVWEVDLLERSCVSDLPVTAEGEILLDLGPFQIRTLRAERLE